MEERRYVFFYEKMNSESHIWWKIALYIFTAVNFEFAARNDERKTLIKNHTYGGTL